MTGLIFLMVVGTSIWVLLDAKSIGVPRRQSDMGPWAWFFCCLLLWIIAFPVYLTKRGQFKRLDDAAQAASNTDGRRKCPFCAEGIQPAAVVCRYCGRDLPSASNQEAGNTPLPNAQPGINAAAMAFSSLPHGGRAGCPSCFKTVTVGDQMCLHCGTDLPQFAGVTPESRPSHFSVKATVFSSLGVLVILIAIGIVGARSQAPPDAAARARATRNMEASPKAATPSTAPVLRSGLSMENYLRLSDGMTYREVVAILGESGKELSRTDLGETTTVMYMWSTWTGANMNAMFQGDRLVSKAQFGF